MRHCETFLRGGRQLLANKAKRIRCITGKGASEHQVVDFLEEDLANRRVERSLARGLHISSNSMTKRMCLPCSSSASSISSYHAYFSERKPSTGSAESNFDNTCDPSDNTGKVTSPLRRPRIPFGPQERSSSSSPSSLSIDSNRTTSTGFLASLRALLSSEEASEKTKVGAQLAKLEQKIEENRNDREILKEAVDAARKYGKCQLAGRARESVGKSHCKGGPVEGDEKKAEEESERGRQRTGRANRACIRSLVDERSATSA